VGTLICGNGEWLRVEDSWALWGFVSGGKGEALHFKGQWASAKLLNAVVLVSMREEWLMVEGFLLAVGVAGKR
jgi:hypothetical protein